MLRLLKIFALMHAFGHAGERKSLTRQFLNDMYGILDDFCFMP